MTDKENRRRILDKIKALLAKTVENGCTEQDGGPGQSQGDDGRLRRH
jgi:hypothetical protein